MKKGRYKSLGPLEAHYIGNICFLPDNYIPKNASKLSGIPTVIIHGRYDMICRPINAYVLHKLIKGSKLYFTFAGHSSSDGGTVKKTVEEMDKFANILK
jgi:proline iminopeptidase